MSTTRFAVTYAVTFEKSFFYQGIYYYPGVEYCFTVLSESDHPGDVFDDADSDFHQRFDCIDREGRIVVENFKPLAADPVIKGIRKVMLAEAGETEAGIKNFMETGKKEAALIIAPKRTISARVWYDTLEDLASSVNELLTSEEIPFDFSFVSDDAIISLPKCDGGGTYPWNPTLAHYCFGKGHINETRLVEELFKRENRTPGDADPDIKGIREVTPPAADENENELS
jgi:hypothetical protein